MAQTFSPRCRSGHITAGDPYGDPQQTAGESSIASKKLGVAWRVRRQGHVQIRWPERGDGLRRRRSPRTRSSERQRSGVQLIIPHEVTTGRSRHVTSSAAIRLPRKIDFSGRHSCLACTTHARAATDFVRRFGARVGLDPKSETLPIRIGLSFQRPSGSLAAPCARAPGPRT